MASSESSPSPSNSSSPEGAVPSEKWLVRILLALAFGLAFGIEGMTLVRSFVIEDEPETKQTVADTPPVVEEGTVLVPSTEPTVRVRRMRLTATDDEWRFTLAVRPDTALAGTYTLSFDRLTLGNGTARTAAPSHTWAPSDTTSFTASWALRVGQRPATLTVTATTSLDADSTTTATRTVEFGHIPVRQR